MMSAKALGKYGKVDPKTGKGPMDYQEDHATAGLKKTLEYYHKKSGVQSDELIPAGAGFVFKPAEGSPADRTPQARPHDPSAPVADAAPSEGARPGSTNPGAGADGLGVDAVWAAPADAAIAPQLSRHGKTAGGVPGIELQRDEHGFVTHLGEQRLGVPLLQIEGAPADAEILPQFFGRAAKTMGLRNPTHGGDLNKFFETARTLARGFVPGTGEREGVGQAGDGHSIGIDMTFSAPKAVSNLAMLGGESVRVGVYEMHDRAVKKAIGHLEKWLMTRLGTNGVEKAHVKGLVAALHTHRASRELDPQLHTHVMLFNIIERLERQGNKGRWGAYEGKSVFDLKMALGALYRSELAKGMDELGFTVQRCGHNHRQDEFTIAGIPEERLEQSSKRAKQMQVELERTGRSGAEAKQKAALATRRAKDEPAFPQLREHWRTSEGNYGFTPENIEALRFMPQKRLMRMRDAARVAGPDSLEMEAFATARADFEASRKPFSIDWKELFNAATQMESTFLERDIIRLVAARSVGHWGADQVVAEVQEAMAREGLIELTMDAFKRKRYTTPEMDRLETRFVDMAGEGLASTAHQIDPDFVDAHIAKFERRKTREIGGEFRLKDEQRNAVRYLLSESGAVALVEGVAGAGKTTMAEAMREVAQAAGYSLVGCSTSGKAARTLQAETGIGSFTIAKLLMKLDHGSISLDEKTLLVIDEAGMVGSRPMARLGEYVQKAGAKMIGLGDTRQLQPVEAGALMRTSIAQFGSLIATNLREITRQKEQIMLEVVHRAMHAEKRAYKINHRGEEINAAGEVAKDLGEKIPLRARPVLTPEAAAAQAEQDLKAVQSYFAALKDKPNEPAKARNTSSETRAARINEQVRAILRAENRLSGEDFALLVERAPEGLTGEARTRAERSIPLAVGERIRFTRANAQLPAGHNASATILGLRWGDLPAGGDASQPTEKSLFATLRMDAQAGSPAREVEVNLSSFPHVAHDYCRVSAKAAAKSSREDAVPTNARVVIDMLHELGRLQLDADPDALEARMVSDYLSATMLDGDKVVPVPVHEKMMLAGLNEEVHRLNNLARAALKEQGVVAKDNLRFLLNEDKPEHYRELSVGDRVVFTKPSKEPRVENASLGAITNLKYDGSGALIATVRLDALNEQSEPREVEINLRNFKGLQHGYCISVHKSQGATLQKTFSLLSQGMNTLEWTYVALSRARLGAMVYATERDVSHAMPELSEQKKLSKEALAAIRLEANLQELSFEIGRSGAKTSSIDHPSADIASRPEGLVALREAYQPPKQAMENAMAKRQKIAEAKARRQAADGEGQAPATGQRGAAAAAPAGRAAPVASSVTAAGSQTGAAGGAGKDQVAEAQAKAQARSILARIAGAGSQASPAAEFAASTTPRAASAANHFVPGRPSAVDQALARAQRDAIAAGTAPSNAVGSSPTPLSRESVAAQASALEVATPQAPTTQALAAHAAVARASAAPLAPVRLSTLIQDKVAQRKAATASAGSKSAPDQPVSVRQMIAQALERKAQERQAEAMRAAARQAQAAADQAKAKEAEQKRKSEAAEQKRVASEAAKKAREDAAKSAEAARQAAAGAKRRARGRGAR